MGANLIDALNGGIGEWSLHGLPVKQVPGLRMIFYRPTVQIRISAPSQCTRCGRPLVRARLPL